MPGARLATALTAVLPAAAAASIILTILCLLYHLCREASKRKERRDSNVSIWPSIIINTDSRGDGIISKRQRTSNHKDPLDFSLKQSSKLTSIWRSTYPIKAFDWNDNPSLVSEAVEHGWLTYAFTFGSHLADSTIPRPNLWEACTATRFSHLHDLLFTTREPEIAWEVCGASSDYMQKIRLNPSFSLLNKKGIPLRSRVQSLQTALPLPGPSLGPLSFPREGYYEVTIFTGSDESFAELSHSSLLNDSEHVKLIAPRSSTVHRVSSASYVASDAPLHAGSEDQIIHRCPSSFSVSSIGTTDPHENGALENVSQNGCMDNGQYVPALQSAVNEQQICAIGLAAGCAPPFRLPGSDSASVGFFSNGRVFVNGTEQKKPINWQHRIWGPATTGAAPTTVGCGFDPTARRLFFTLNGEMVEDIPLPAVGGDGCRAGDLNESSTGESKLMEFTAHPLFPTIGANYSVTVTANFGQAAFEYAAANAQRVPDPCFRRQPASASAAKGGGAGGGGEDSADLFSMGRIDSQWLADVAGTASPKTTHQRRRPPISGRLRSLRDHP